ncbi:MAG: DUF3298 domain-containing protein [Lachnospiraceae bacterium]|nr:DUF3298 domain-containing protein [Lachnospiraceae bacterium]
MSKLEKMKKEYDDILIPAELGIRIQQEIEKSQRRQRKKGHSLQHSRLKKILHRTEAAAAAICLLFTVALNTNEAFAKGAADIPVIGELARILTFRSYEREQDDIGISVKIPSVEMIEKDTGLTMSKINQEIYMLCEQYAKEAVLRAEEYREAFLETGGTAEEWAEHHVKITVDYEIKQKNNTYLSFMVRGTESWTNAYNASKYYNLSLETGDVVTLEDMLGSEYIELANESIREQISERQRAGEPFFTEEEGGFTGISEDAKFYINQENRPVIVFDRYEIAPGSSGEPEFEIGGSSKSPNAQQSVTQETVQEETPEEGRNESVQGSQRYQDNFQVDAKTAEEFAGKIKEAVAHKDLEALMEFMAFPVYVGLPEVGTVETQEELLEIGAEALFTEGLLSAVEGADIKDLPPSMAGFSISDGGTANINFGVVDGVLAINGINY